MRAILLSIPILVAAAAVPGELRVDEPRAQEAFRSALQGSFHAPSAAVDAARALPAQKHKDVVKRLGDWAKAYAGSEVFRTWYAKFREESKPAAPEAPKDAAADVDEQVRELKKGIAEMEKQAKTADAELRKMLKEGIGIIQEQVKELEKDRAAQIEYRNEAAKAQSEADKAAYAEDLVAWEAGYPADPKRFVRHALDTLLADSEGVRWDAATIERYGQRRFTDPALEKRNSTWKACFRAGKDACEAARAYARSWSAELK